MSDLDDELDRAREKSQVRFRSAFEAIFKKYGQIDEEDDIIDLSTGQLLVDNGRMRNAKLVELGDLTRPSDALSSPRANKRHKGQWSLSPELGSKYPLHNGDTDNGEFVDSNESDYFDAEFGMMDYGHGVQWDRDSMNRAESVGYESSDSVDTGELPLDAYFTTSIEHYLDRLRQQLAAPDPDSPDSPDTNSSSPNMETARIFDPQRMGIYSSPRTISSDFEDQLANSWSRSVHADEYISESPSRTEERIYSREGSNEMSEEEPIEEYEVRHNVYHSAVPHMQHILPRPVLFKPQPVSPHVFFEGSDPRASNHVYPSPGTNYDLAYDDDNASIHSGESIHSLPDYSASCIPYDLQVSDNSYFMQ
ncbi:hypothetical protein IW148_003688 [Coemansia sp. RSA 1199]|nr:hypothetical protein IW148_003688 [Coemansia sp. RSA 1199]